MKSNNIDYVSENEEWIARYRKLQNSLEQIKTNDESNHNDWLVAATLVTRAGRLGMLQCATRDQGENTPSIENLLDQTKHEMDLDAASPKELLLLERLAAAAAAAPQNNHLDVQSQTSNVKEDICTAVDVDAFFEEYPECVKPSWDNRSEEVMDSSSDDDSETEVVEQRPRKDTKEESHPQQVIDVDESSNNRQRPHSLNPLAQAQQQQQQQQQRPPSSSGRTQPRNPIVNNPYGNTRTQVPPRNPYQTTQHSNSFSYTPSTQPKADQSSSDNHNLLQNKNNNKNKNNNMPRGNQRYRPPSSYNASSLNRSSWEEHQNQQNPFQTARELAQIEEPTNKNDNNNSRNQERQDSGNWNQGQSNPYQNPYSRNNGTIRNDTVDEEATHVRGGPSIPQSLQRKFQVPMRNNEVRRYNIH